MYGDQVGEGATPVRSQVIDGKINQENFMVEPEITIEEDCYRNISVAGVFVENRMVTKVEIGSLEFNAMFDSGAESNLIPLEVLTSVGISYEPLNHVHVLGFGTGSPIKVLGKASIALRLHGLTLPACEFLVMKADHLKNFIVLGVQFLRENELVLNVQRRRVRREFANGSIWDCYLGSCEEACRIVWSKLPVSAVKGVVVQPRETKAIEVSYVYPDVAAEGCCRCCACSKLFFLDEAHDATYLQLLSGLMPCSNAGTTVLILNNGTRTERVKENQLIGTCSSVVDSAELSLGRDVGVVLLECSSNEFSGGSDCTKKVELGDHLTEAEQIQIKCLLKENIAVFGADDDIGMIDVAPHKIELTEHNPIYQRPRRFPEPVNQEIEAQCKELELLDIIESCNSGWSSPVVPIRKRDGTIRLCVDYRRLNSVTKADKHPLPNLSDAVFGLHGVKYFTTLDLIRGYYQVPLDAESRPFTAFSTARGHWQFKRLSFGLKNAPSAFQRTMQMVLSGFSWRKVIVYIDDILIMGETWDEHLSLCRRVLETLMSYGVKLRLEKCRWFCREVEFLGHLVSTDGLRKPESYIKAVEEFPQPKTKTQLRGFLGLLNFQRKFVPNCSLIMKPLSQATGGKNASGRVSWTDEMISAFVKLKREIAEDVRLAFPDYGDDAEPLAVYTDASGRGIGACLTQVQNGLLRVIAYASVAFNTAEVRYSTIERELAAIRWAVKTFRPFLFGIEFVVNTDHKPLLHLYNLQIVNMRIARTLRELSEYNFSISFTPGRENIAADALSRREHDAVLKCTDENEEDTGLPAGVVLAKEVPGGGDALLESLLVAGKCLGTGVAMPGDVHGLRAALVEELIRDPDGYGVPKNKSRSRDLKLMLHSGQLLCCEAITAFAHLYECAVFVHVGRSFPIIHQSPFTSIDPDIERVHIQCLAGIHYNPLLESYSYQVPKFGTSHAPATFHYVSVGEGEEMHEREELRAEDVVEISTLFAEQQQWWPTGWCSVHPRSHSASIMVDVGGLRLCALLDTGAQVSCVLLCIVLQLGLQIEPSGGLEIVGIGSGKTKVLGTVALEIQLDGVNLSHRCVVVEGGVMKFCVVVGMDFMTSHELQLDMSKRLLATTNKIVNIPPFEFEGRVSDNQLCGVCQVVGVNSQGDQHIVTSLDLNEVRELQKHNQISQVKRKVQDNVEGPWPASIKKFRRHRQKFAVVDEVLVYDNGCSLVPLVPFQFVVEFCLVFHHHRAHPGRQKLQADVVQHVWHPSVAAVAADITRTCDRCQRGKVASVAQPPVRKIQTSVPFELLAVDLLALPRTAGRKNCCLVVVDHNSKWLSVVPLPDKTAATVAAAMETRVLPSLVKLPERILSDNGPEFRSGAFAALLDGSSIKHVFTTAYKPASNGLVERTNRTILELLRNLGAEPHNWDTYIPSVVMMYNGSTHSELQTSPSNYLLSREHLCQPELRVPIQETTYWREGNPSFKSFKVGQLVLRRVVFVGKRVQDKLADRYSGPFQVVRLNLNRVTYIVKSLDGPQQYKVHHTQLRRFYRPPNYLLRHPSYSRIVESDGDVRSGGEESEDLRACGEGDTPGCPTFGYSVPGGGAVCADSSESSSEQSDEEGLSSGPLHSFSDSEKGESRLESAPGAHQGKFFEDYIDEILAVEAEYERRRLAKNDEESNGFDGDRSSLSGGATWSVLAKDSALWDIMDITLSVNEEDGSRLTVEEVVSDSSALSLEEEGVDGSDVMEEPSVEDEEIFFSERFMISTEGSTGIGLMHGMMKRLSRSLNDLAPRDRVSLAEYPDRWSTSVLSALDLAGYISIEHPIMTKLPLVKERKRADCEFVLRIEKNDKPGSSEPKETGRMTRSMGPVEDLPRVQLRTLEYKERAGCKRHVNVPGGEE